MSVLNTELMGLKLKSPVVLGACSHSLHTEKLQQIEEAGAGAIVFKTLFEEQIQMERLELEELLTLYDDRNAEMGTLFPHIEHAGPEEHILNIRKAVDALTIPVIASLNCVYDVSWTEYAQKLADSGVAALELNFYDTPKKLERTGIAIEEMQSKVIEAVKKVVKIPVQVKLSRYYTNPLNLIKQLDNSGANSFVLFNKLFLPTIDAEKEEFHLSWDYSAPSEKAYAIRFAGLLYGRINADIVGNTGIYTHEDIASMVLAGANSVQMVSAIYKYGPQYISEVLDNLRSWLDAKNYNSLDDARGKLAFVNQTEKQNYTRAQYVDILLNRKPGFITEIL